MFTVALDRHLVDAHPAARVIKRFSETPRERDLTDDELRTLWAGLDARPGAASDAMRLRLLLGQRGAETAGMLWPRTRPRHRDLDAPTAARAHATRPRDPAKTRTGDCGRTRLRTVCLA